MSEREKALAAREELVGVLSMLERQEFRAGYDARDAEVEALRKRVEDLKLALGNNAGWFDRYRAERTRAETAERKLAEVREKVRELERDDHEREISFRVAARATEAAERKLAEVRELMPPRGFGMSDSSLLRIRALLGDKP